MTLEGMAVYAKEVADHIQDKKDKVHIYQVALWLQELSDYRNTYDSDKDYIKIDKSTKELIEREVDKRGCI